MELPVITTNWSGPTAFMNEQVAYPLAIDGLSVVKSDGVRRAAALQLSTTSYAESCSDWRQPAKVAQTSRHTCVYPDMPVLTAASHACVNPPTHTQTCLIPF